MCRCRHAPVRIDRARLCPRGCLPPFVITPVVHQVETELRRVEEAARLAEKREMQRRRAFERYLATESQRLVEELAGRSAAKDEILLAVERAPPPSKRAMDGADEMTMTQVLDEMQTSAIDELSILDPNAGRERCRELLERCEWSLSSAACELLALD